MTDWVEQHGDHFAGCRVCVTGGAGFIGSHLVTSLMELGAEVVVVDDLSGGDWANLSHLDPQPTCVTGSILDGKLLADCLGGCRYLFHLAALGSVPLSVQEPMRFHGVNATGTVRVLEAARAASVQRLIFAGSSSAYGDPPEAEESAKVETQAPLPLSPYAATKLAGEHACRAWSHSYGLDTAVLRYFNIFGPRQNTNSAYAAVIAAFAAALLRGERPTIFGDGTQSRDFTYVDNAVHANLLAARHPSALQGRVFNVATGRRVSIDTLARRMAESLQRPDLSPIHAPPRTGDVRHSLADISRARDVLDYRPLVDFDTGLAQTISWYQENLPPEAQ